MKKEPCAKFTIRVTPKMMDSPEATRNSVEALARPFRNWRSSSSIYRDGGAAAPVAVVTDRCSARRPQLGGLRRRRQQIVAGDVLPVHHDALAVLDVGPADEHAHGRLVVRGAEGNLAQ